MEKNKLPEIFDSFNDARKNGFITVKNLKDQGKNIVGTFCTYTPVEVFMAADAVYVGLCSTSDETIAEAEKILPRNLCPLIKSSYGFNRHFMHFLKSRHNEKLNMGITFHI